jgi:hypothetical protein
MSMPFFAPRWSAAAVRLWVCLLVSATGAGAEVVNVTITRRTPVADGMAFGRTGAYEKLQGTIEIALDPANAHNRRIADLDRAPRASDGRVHVTADLFVLQPVDRRKGNDTMLFEVANRGAKLMLGRFNRAPGSADPTTAADMGDGFLMREGYTLVWVGWQFDVAAPGLRVEAPRADVSGLARVAFVADARVADIAPAGLPNYPPAVANDPSATLTVRDRFWESPRAIARDRWRLTTGPTGPRVALDGDLEPGRVYELEYAATGARVAGVGLAALRDAAAAFKTRTDLPVRARRAYAFGISQSGRLLRQFLHDGFNADERNGRVFDAVWAHIAGAGQGSFNERFAMPGYMAFTATRFPFTDAVQTGGPGGAPDGIQAAYSPGQTPKVFYTNTPVEYWGQGRAAALTHTSLDGTRDLRLPANVRSYLLAGTQHTEAAFPPPQGFGQELNNPIPQGEIMRALLRNLHRWVATGVQPPGSRHPLLADGSLAAAPSVKFPSVLGVSDPRTIEGPAFPGTGTGPSTPLPFLVPQVDDDGNDTAGIRTPEQAVPLATTTGWNFRAGRIGNPSATYPLLGSYIPLARTKTDREARRDPRLSIEERYASKDEYLQKIRAAADDLVKVRLMLADDVEGVLARAGRHWDYATSTAAPAAPRPSGR